MNYDYLSAEDFDLMTEDELDEYYKHKNKIKENGEEQQSIRDGAKSSERK